MSSNFIDVWIKYGTKQMALVIRNKENQFKLPPSCIWTTQLASITYWMPNNTDIEKKNPFNNTTSST